MELGQNALTILAGVLMVIGLFVSLIPFVPGSLLLWGIALAYAALTDFEVLSIVGVVVISVLALISTTKDFWMPLLGMRTRGASCGSVVATMVGGLIGTLVIPVPILGTLIGMVLGALVVEGLQLGNLRGALRAASTAFETFLYGMIAEFALNIVIVAVFFISLVI